MAIKIKKKTSGLDENTPRIKIARASSGSGVKKPGVSGRLKVGYNPTSSKSPGTSSSKPGAIKSSGGSNSGIVLADGKKFKLSIAPNMRKVSVSNLSNGVINEYDRLADEFKNKTIDNEKRDLNQYWQFKNGELVKGTYAEIPKEERARMTREFNQYAKAEGQKCKDEGKLWKFDEKSIARTDGVVTFPSDQLRAQGASESYIEKAEKDWIDRTAHSINKVYGKEDPVILRVHLDETNPHIHYSVIPRLKEDRYIQAKRRDGSTYDKVIQKGTIGSKHIIDPEFLSKDLSNSMRESFKESKTLNKIDWGKLDKEVLRQQRADMGLKGDVNLATYKTTKDQHKTPQRTQARDLIEESKLVESEAIRQALFKVERQKVILEKRRDDLAKREKQSLQSKNKLVLKKEIKDTEKEEE